MSSYIFNKLKNELCVGNVVLSGANNDYTLALVVSGAAFSAATSAVADVTGTWATLSATWDISTAANSAYNSTAYTVRGLSGLTVSADYTNDKILWKADNITWASSTIDADGCAIYKTSNNLMVCAIDFGAKKSSSNGDFTVSWNSSGIINLN